MLRGRLLYSEFVNNKPPLLYVYYAAAQWLAGRGLFAVHLVTTMVTVPLIALAVSACYRHRRPGVVAALAFLVYSAAFIGHDMLSANTEILMLLPASWAVVVLRDGSATGRPWRVVAAGALIGCGVLLKYQVGTWLAAFALAVLVHEVVSRKRNGETVVAGAVGAAAVKVGWLAAGFVVPLAATYWYFASQGGAEALLYWTIGNNLRYTSNPILLREAAERAVSYFVPFVVVTAPLWWATAKGCRRLEPQYWQVLVLGLVVVSIPPALLGWRFYPHYFIQLYVPLALAAAPTLTALFDARHTRAARLVAMWTFVMLAGFMVANAILYLGDVKVYRERDPVFRKIGERLRADPCYVDGSLFVWGYAPIIYYYADMPAASRFVVMAQSRLTGYLSGNLASNRGELPTDHLVEPGHWDWLMDDLERNHVTFVVDTAPADIYRWGRYPIDDYPRLARYLSDSFTLVDTVDRVRIFRRTGCVPPGSR